MNKRAVLIFALLMTALTACSPSQVQPVFTPDGQITSTPMTFAPKAPKVAAVLPGRITSFDVKPDMLDIAIGTSRGVEVYEIETGILQVELLTDMNITSLGWSADGEYLAVGSIEGFTEQGIAHLQIWDSQTWQRTDIQLDGSDLVNERYLTLDWSPDGTKLAAGTDVNGVLVWDVATQKVISQQTGFASSVRDIDWSPDGTRLIATSDLAYGIRRWVVKTGNSVRLFDQRNSSAMVLAWSPDGSRIASGHIEGTICFWTSATNQCDGLVQAHRSAVFSLAWSADGSRLATGAGVIRIWDAGSGKLIEAFGEYEDQRYIEIEWPSMDAPLFTLQESMEDASITTLRLWNVTDGTILVEFQGSQDG